MRLLIFSMAMICAPSLALAEGPLQITEVLESVAATHPTMAGARASVDLQRGRRTAAARATEPKVGVAASAVPAGYYDYWQLAATIEQRVPSTGVKLLGGYRLGRGDIPVYYGERETRDGGELFAKVNVPLLADRSIDKERAEIAKARIATSQAGFELDTAWLDIARKASLGYWEWVAAGQKLRAATELLRIAQERAVRIHRQVDSGASPRIVVVDADRMVFSRQTKLLQARGKFASAQQKLSLFYRTSDGIPIVAAFERVPGEIVDTPSISEDSIQDWIDVALARRPELKVADSQKRQAGVDRALARNRGLPTLDANAFVARDLGDGSSTLGGTDVGVGLTFSLPLFQREGRGMRRQADAKLAIIEAKQRGMRDQIAASIRQSAQLVRLASERRRISLDQLMATEQLAEAERERMRQGASDLMTLNLRELDVAAAANEVIDSDLEAHSATIELFYSRGATVLESY